MERLPEVVETLNRIEKRKNDEKGYTLPPDQWHTVERNKYIALDVGTSGAFLVERDTGEIFNITGYGRPDKNKKKKSDLGNIATVDCETLHAKRYNYLR